MRGGKPKPAAKQIAEGDPAKKGVHKLDQQLAAEPKAEDGLPECPEHLSGPGREAWDFWCPALASMNLAKQPDALTLEAACMAYHELREAYDALESDGRTLADNNGRQYNHPAVTRMKNSMTAVRSFTSEFGLSPVGRTRLTIDKRDDGEADMMKELSKPRPAKKEAVQ